MVFVYKKLAQFAVWCPLPPRRSESPVCATDNKPSCVLHLLGWFIGSRGFSSLEQRPEFWVLQHKPAFLLIKHPCSIRAWVPMSFFLSFSLSPPPSSSLFQFLIVDSGPPGSGPLKDHNTWSWHIFQCYNYQFIPLYQIFNFMVQLFFYNKSGNKNILTSGLQPKHHFMNEIYAILTPTR